MDLLTELVRYVECMLLLSALLIVVPQLVVLVAEKIWRFRRSSRER